ncbi:MAG: 2-amino-4-hydroxy-6-hydroxymethyldihydropteridine diphosphokinase [Chitinophagaceae bacterium]|jgi:2-amino-4-hydroxy-6-hydroxymethyldihydropteridine diphosphokinase|nr:2-amino-4-hydroxy-6-hydroxymethyldihydropteridine diphosphokinase [Chitinophagaceae bacterium]
MNTAYLLTGGNLGDRMAHLDQAARLIEQNCGLILQRSPVYETAAWGLNQQPPFLNQAIALQTSLAPEALMTKLLQIETGMGRIRTVKMGPRTIDLDILLIDDLVYNTPLLTLPHPALPDRRFALAPLADIAPTLVHPISGKNITQLLLECTDPLDVQKK